MRDIADHRGNRCHITSMVVLMSSLPYRFGALFGALAYFALWRRGTRNLDAPGGLLR